MQQPRTVASAWTLGILLAGCSVFPSTAQAPAECDPTVTDCPIDAGARAADETPPSHKDASVPSEPVDGSVSAADTAPPVDAAPADTSECGSTATMALCGTCCDSKHTPGLTVWNQAFGDCNCNSPGKCQSQCSGSYCNGTNPATGSACDACLTAQSTGQCGTTADTACNANTDCVAWDACYVASKCDSKT